MTSDLEWNPKNGFQREKEKHETCCIGNAVGKTTCLTNCKRQDMR
jgi:hypothetical protein